MTTFTDTKVISLNSESASLKNGSYLSSVSFNLQGLLRSESDIIHTQLALQNAQVPVSFYIINYANKTFIIRFSSVDYTITVPVGNYNATTLADALKSGIYTATSGLGGVTITIAISKTTGIYTFSCGVGFTIRASLPSFTMQLPLGTGTTDLVSTFNGIEHTKTLPFPCNLLGAKLLQINSPTISGNNFASNLNGQTTLLATIPVQAQSFGLILYADTGDTRVSFNNNSLDGIDLDIVDAETGQYINFNNCNWTMTLLLHITRRYGEWKNQTAAIENTSVTLPDLPKPLTKNEKDLNLLLGN
jgi:hypothetical protein